MSEVPQEKVIIEREHVGPIQFISTVVDRFMKHDLLTLSASLAFYTAFSLAPLLLITFVVIGLLGPGTQQSLIDQIGEVVGTQAAQAISLVVDNTERQEHFGSLTGIFGLATLLFSASIVFAQLQTALNVIFEAPPLPAKAGVVDWFKKRLFSMGMVLALAFLALVSLILSAILRLAFPEQGGLWEAVNFVGSILVFGFLFTVIFRYLPDVALRWKEAARGGAVTAILFSVGKFLIGLYLGRSAVGSAYGAAGSLVVLLIWVYYSSVIVFVGAEITHVLTLLRLRRRRRRSSGTATSEPLSP